MWPYNQLRFSRLLEGLEWLSHDSSLDRKKQSCTSCSVACSDTEPTKNTFIPRRMISCTVSFKSNVMRYVKEHDNRTTKQHFGVHQPQKWCMENKRGRVKRCTLQNVLDRKAKVKDWVTDYRNNGFSCHKKWPFLKQGDRWSYLASVTSIGQFLDVNRFMKKHGLQNMRQSKPWKNVRSVMLLIVLKTKWFWKKFKFRWRWQQEWSVWS